MNRGGAAGRGKLHLLCRREQFLSGGLALFHFFGLGFLDIFTGLQPAGDAGGKMLDILESEFLRLAGTSLVGAALRASTVSYDERVFGFVLENFIELFTLSGEVNCGRDMPFGVGLRAVDIEEDDFLLFDCLLQFFDADVGKFGRGGERESSDHAGCDGDKSFHRIVF